MADRIPVSPTATPVIIAGAPRSGTTLLTAALNSHPQVLITNELRAWNVFNDIRRRTKTPSEILPKHPLRDPFRKALMHALVQTFRDFYTTQVTKERLGCPAETGDSVAREIRAYGDKNPGYADTHSPDCLPFIAHWLPDAKFIHIHRDPRSCVASYKAIPVYSNEISRCIDTWRRHASSMAALRDTLGPERVLEFAYEEFVGPKGGALFERIEDHIGVEHAREPQAFLTRERTAPIPYRSPTTPHERLGRTTYRDRLKPKEIAEIETACAELMERYGYSPNA
jgi:hypothetical protein